jgi:hypothetical protein
LFGGFENERTFAPNNYLQYDTQYSKQSPYFPNYYSTPETEWK